MHTVIKVLTTLATLGLITLTRPALLISYALHIRAVNIVNAKVVPGYFASEAAARVHHMSGILTVWAVIMSALITAGIWL